MYEVTPDKLPTRQVTQEVADLAVAGQFSVFAVRV